MTWRPAHLVLICRVKSLRNVNFFLTDILGDTITPYNVSKRPQSVLRFFSFSFSNVASCLLGWRPRTAKPSRRWCSSSVEVWSPLISSHKWESFLSCMKKRFLMDHLFARLLQQCNKKSWGYNIWCHKHLERVIGQIWACFVEHMSSTPVLFACDSVSRFNPARTSFALSFMLCNEADAIYAIW